MTNEQDWKETLEDLDLRRQRSRAMGGPERLAKHRGKGKLDARARLEHLLDKGTFREFGTLVGGEIAADGIVAGSGLIDGSPVMVGAEDFTTLAGSIGPGGNAKRYRLAELALRDKIPLVMLLEGAGFRPSGEHYGRTPTDLLAQAQCSGKVPTVAGLLGPSAGHGALVAPVCDLTIMSRQGAIFTAGPPVVKESTGEEISKEDLGGPDVALASGVIHNLAEDDEAVLDDIRRYLSYFPVERMVVSAGIARRRDQRAATDARTARHRAPRQPPRLRHARRARRRLRPSRLVRGAAEVRAGDHLRARPPRRPSRRGRRQPAEGARRLDRCRRRRQGSAFHHGGRLVPPADRLPRRQPGHAARQPVREERCAAQRRADVRRPDRGDDAQAARDAAQGVRVRLDGDVAAGIRQPERDVRLSRARRWAR